MKATYGKFWGNVRGGQHGIVRGSRGSWSASLNSMHSLAAWYWSDPTPETNEPEGAV